MRMRNAEYLILLLIMYVCVMFSAVAHAQCDLDPRFKQTSWSVGSTYYTDRAYTITSLSDDLQGHADCLPYLIKTPNDERNNTQSSGYMTFTMPFVGFVDIAFDSRLTSLPTWASDYTKWTGHTISTSLSSQPHMQIYFKKFYYGDCVDLGGNKGSGASTGTASNYVVFLEAFFCIPSPPPPCSLDSKFDHSGSANNGATYYTDRSYTITDAGPFAGMEMIKTPNNDRNSTISSDYLTWEAPGDGYLYIGYDKRATTPPNWLTSTFTQIPCAKISTSLSSQGWLDVYKRSVSLGECLSLGANKAPGFSGGTVSNYIVLYSTNNISDQCDVEPPPPVGCYLDPKFIKITGKVGSTYYTDRAYTITGVSDKIKLANCMGVLIKTPNDDRGNKDPYTYMKFLMPFDGWVNIAFDSRLTNLPNWASNFLIDTGSRIYTSLPTQPFMQFYTQYFAKGECVYLGGNKAAGASRETTSNYVVFVAVNGCDTGDPTGCTLNSKFMKTPFTGVGQSYYTDRSYTITSHITWHGHEEIIKTPNDDRNNTSSSYMRFEMPYNGWVDIAFDSRLTSLPTWASEFDDDYGWQIFTSLGSQPSMNIYGKYYEVGTCVELGGNKAWGASNTTASNYIILLMEEEELPPWPPLNNH